MANIFENIARQATTLSPLIEGKNKISVSEIIETYPEGITITSFDMIAGTDQNGNSITYPVFVFAEDETRFGFGGKVLKGIVEAWIAAFDGDIEATSKSLQANGGAKLRFRQGRTKTGRNLTIVEPVNK